MKKIIILSLLFIIVIPKPSYSEFTETEIQLLTNNLLAIQERLFDNREKLRLIQSDFRKEMQASDQLLGVMIIGEMGIIKTTTLYIQELLAMFPAIKHDFILNYIEREIQIINDEKRMTYDRLERIIKYSAHIENKASLYHIDKVKDTIRSLIKIFDETIVILEKSMTKITKQ